MNSVCCASLCEKITTVLSSQCSSSFLSFFSLFEGDLKKKSSDRISNYPYILGQSPGFCWYSLVNGSMTQWIKNRQKGSCLLMKIDFGFYFWIFLGPITIVEMVFFCRSSKESLRFSKSNFRMNLKSCFQFENHCFVEIVLFLFVSLDWIF